MLSDIIKDSSIACSNVPGLGVTYYLNGSNSTAGVLTAVDSITLPAGVFGVDGDVMDFEYFGTMAGDADTEISLYFGTDALFSSGVIDPGNEDFYLTGKMIRTGPTTQYTVATLKTSTVTKTTLNSTAITFGPAIVLALKGIGTSGSAVSCRGAIRRFWFQNR